jgi:hypothetical protein
MLQSNYLNPTFMAQKRSYKKKLSEEVEAGTYVNAVSVHVNNNEVTIDMAYTLPQIVNKADEQTIKIHCRANMTHKTADSFLSVLSNAILDWKNKQKKVAEKQDES